MLGSLISKYKNNAPELQKRLYGNKYGMNIIAGKLSLRLNVCNEAYLKIGNILVGVAKVRRLLHYRAADTLCVSIASDIFVARMCVFFFFC